ncbi:NAD(P)-binding protein [Gymnopus androsaceus JB14]|uniref:NAD(P)-binding protein n=1 Tax=Gymnopus androsaceus JB14 TaxID=1447944 RepID=A0A6A4HGL3_9AGAR|nr:NAD(P)-binding protein [Gymnopus androsaceus JB14]
MDSTSTNPALLSQQSVWLITGATSGIGLEVVKVILQKGHIAISTFRSIDKPPVLEELESPRLLSIHCDLTSEKDIKDLFSKAESTFGRIDVVFNNAGIGMLSEIEGAPIDKARGLFEVNFWGTALVSQEAVRVFRDVNPKSGIQGGRLLNMSSLAGIAPAPGIGFYSASKNAFEALTEALANEMDPAWNIKITVIEPGAFKTRAHTDNNIVVPSHPAYANKPSLGSNKMRKWFADGSGITGDPTLAAKRIYEFTQDESAPIRIQLGDACWHGVKGRLETLVEEQKTVEKWSKGLDFENDEQ